MLFPAMLNEPAFVYWIARVVALCIAAYGVPVPYLMPQPWLTWFQAGWTPVQVIRELSTPAPYDIETEALVVVNHPILFCQTGVIR